MDLGTLRTSRASTSASESVPGGLPSSAPPAQRTRTPGWRDPRLWVGLALVAGSVLLGARVVAAADDTVPVWAARADLGAGSTLRPDDLVREQVRLSGPADLDRYLRADEPLPAEAGLLRPVGAGELVPRAALGERSGTVEVPLAVDPEQVPESVRQGSVVDVYLLGSSDSSSDSSSGSSSGSATGATDAPGGAPALAGVSVVDARTSEESLAVSGKRRLVLAVPEDAAAGFFRRLGALQGPQIVVVGRG